MMMHYTEAAYQALVEDIFHRFPSVQKDGFSAGAYKPGLERQQAFEAALGHPSRQFRAIHIAGTNGKGSVANMLASALSACGTKTGLFTSPHLIDFRERMLIAGRDCLPGDVALRPCTGKYLREDGPSQLISKEYVFDFLTRWLPWCTEHGLSFFEITTGLAFKWFADEKVDVAVIETGLGGRLDSTNILERPDLTVVTSIGLDHCALLGDTLEKIAAEKAGIFKTGVPALVGEWQAETAPVFEAVARGPLVFASKSTPSLWARHQAVLADMDLQASVQEKNLRTVLAAVDILKQLPGYEALSKTDDLLDGIVHTARNLHFHGRWERLSREPLVLSDIGHNAHALRHNFAQLEALGRPLIIVYGIMADKDLDAILPLMPLRARYIFTTPDTPRALPADEILRRFLSCEGGGKCMPGGLSTPGRGQGEGPVGYKFPQGMAINTVQAAVREALRMATPDTVIYIGGSTYVVAEALPLFPADGDSGHNN